MAMKRGENIARQVKKEVANEEARLEKVRKAKGVDVVVCGDLGCSDPGGCSNYCSES